MVGKRVQAGTRSTQVPCTWWNECVISSDLDSLRIGVEAQLPLLVLLGPFLVMSRSSRRAHEGISDGAARER